MNHRADGAERSRKEVEHRVNSTEDIIDKLVEKLREARNLTDEATKKTDEVLHKIDVKSAR